MAEELSLTAGTIGVDDEMPARFVLALQALMPSAKLSVAGAVLAPLRARKSADEIAALSRAAAATDALIPIAYAACRSPAHPNGTLRGRLVRPFQRKAAMPTRLHRLSAQGVNGASPHHNTGAAQIQTGDVVILDFGAMTDGYHGDITRTVAVGTASDEAKHVYDTVYRAYAAGVAAVQPGALASDVDAAARRVITDAGYGDYFIHRTGHGIGLDDHETPYMMAGNKTLLQPGHCFSIEPGIYLPGRFGVRLENIVTVSEDGTARVLNEAISPEIVVL